MNLLAGGAASLKEGHERIRKIAECLTKRDWQPSESEVGRQRMSRQFEVAGPGRTRRKGKELHELMQSETFFESMPEIESIAQEIVARIGNSIKAHMPAEQQYQEAVEKIKGRKEWEQVPESMREPVLSPLVCVAARRTICPKRASPVTHVAPV